MASRSHSRGGPNAGKLSSDMGRATDAVHKNIATLQYDNLRNRFVELVLGRLPVTLTEPDLTAETLMDEPIVEAASIDSSWAKRRSIALAEVIEEPWMLAHPGSLARSLRDELFLNSGL